MQDDPDGIEEEFDDDTEDDTEETSEENRSSGPQQNMLAAGARASIEGRAEEEAASEIGSDDSWSRARQAIRGSSAAPAPELPLSTASDDAESGAASQPEDAMGVALSGLPEIVAASSAPSSLPPMPITSATDAATVTEAPASSSAEPVAKPSSSALPSLPAMPSTAPVTAEEEAKAEAQPQATAHVDQPEYRFDFGKFRGKTLQEALAKKPDYLDFLVANGLHEERPALKAALVQAGMLEDLLPQAESEPSADMKPPETVADTESPEAVADTESQELTAEELIAPRGVTAPESSAEVVFDATGSAPDVVVTGAAPASDLVVTDIADHESARSSAAAGADGATTADTSDALVDDAEPAGSGVPRSGPSASSDTAEKDRSHDADSRTAGGSGEASDQHGAHAGAVDAAKAATDPAAAPDAAGADADVGVGDDAHSPDASPPPEGEEKRPGRNRPFSERLSKTAELLTDKGERLRDRSKTGMLETEGWLASRVESQTLRSVEDALCDMKAAATGREPPVSSSHKVQRFVSGWCCNRRLHKDKQRVEAAYQDAKFTPEQVIEAFRLTRSQPSLIAQASKGRVTWRYALCLTGICLCLIFWILLLLYFLFALAVFSSRPISVDDSTGAITDPDGKPVGTAATVNLRALWDFPSLSTSDLRTVDDVLFFYNRAAHIIRAASISKSLDGQVEIGAVDGSTLRVQSNGKAFWQRRGFAEAELDAMEAFRAQHGSQDLGMFTSGALSMQVVQPAAR